MQPVATKKCILFLSFLTLQETVWFSSVPAPLPFLTILLETCRAYIYRYIYSPFLLLFSFEIMYLLHIWVTIKMDIIYFFVSKKVYLVTSLTYQLVDNQRLL